jgi:hypothetical protein
MIRIFIYTFALCFVFLRCTVEHITGGSETTNGVKVAINGNNISISGPAGSDVKFYSVDYLQSGNTGPLASIYLNDSGYAVLNAFSTGKFNVFFLNPLDSTMGIIHSISVSHKVKKSWYGKLEFPGALSGKLIISNSSAGGTVAVYLTGTPFIDTSSLDDSTAQFNFNRIPPGAYTIQYGITIRNQTAGIILSRKGILGTVDVKSNQNLNIQEPFRIP